MPPRRSPAHVTKIPPELTEQQYTDKQDADSSSLSSLQDSPSPPPSSSPYFDKITNACSKTTLVTASTSRIKKNNSATVRVQREVEAEFRVEKKRSRKKVVTIKEEASLSTSQLKQEVANPRTRRKRKAVSYKEEDEDEDCEIEEDRIPKDGEKEELAEDEEKVDQKPTQKASRKTKSRASGSSNRKKQKTTITEAASTDTVEKRAKLSKHNKKNKIDGVKKERKPRKTKEEREEEKRRMAIPLAARNMSMAWLVGAHVSAAKGVQNAVTNSVHIGGNAFALFLKSQRKWVSPGLKPEDASAFREFVKKEGYDAKRHILPHGNYLINLAQQHDDKHKQAYDCFLDDLKRCEELGIGLYNFHPGSCLTNPRPDSILRLASTLNTAHEATKYVKTVLENMAGHGSHLGSTLEELRDIISHIKDKSRVGVCIDTCHAFAAGYDLRTKEAFDGFWNKFDKIIGRKYLVGMHLNDSKAPLGSRRDLHASIGCGYLGLEAFRLVMNEERLQGIPLVLETPVHDPAEWAVEVKLLESLVGMTGEEKEFKENVERLQEKGRAEMERIGDVVKRRELKEEQKKERELKKEEKAKAKEKAVRVGKRKKKGVIVEVEEVSEESSEELSSLGSVEEETQEDEEEEHRCNHG